MDTEASGSGGSFIKPELIVSHLHLTGGDVVVDFGAGSGHYVPALAAAVGTTGRVYACEIQKGLVDKISQLIRTNRIANADALWCDLEAVGGTKLKDASVDAGLLVNTFFQIQDKAMALREMARVLRPQGKLFLVDWRSSYGGMGPAPDAVVPPAHARAFVEAAGFAFEREFPAGDHHYGLAFTRV
jgi:ubiquinone/menaquinone biosynthesis C-methylase UbiE